MATDDETLAVTLAIKTQDFERGVTRATKVARDSLNQTFKTGEQAGAQFNETISSGVLGSIAKYAAFYTGFKVLTDTIRSGSEGVAKSIADTAGKAKKALTDMSSVTTIRPLADNASQTAINNYIDRVTKGETALRSFAVENEKAREELAAFDKTWDGSTDAMARNDAMRQLVNRTSNSARRGLLELSKAEADNAKAAKDGATATKKHGDTMKEAAAQVQSLFSAHTGLHIAIVKMIPLTALLTVAIGGGLAAGITVAVEKLGKLTDGMNDLSASSGITVDKLFKFRAGLGSEDMDKFSGTISGITDKLNQMLANPLEASDFSRGLRALGIQFKANSDRAEVMLKIFQQIGRIGDPVKQAAYAKLFGIDNAGLAMIRSGDFQKAYQQSQVDAKNLQALGEEWKRTGKIIDGIFVDMWNTFSGASAKSLTEALAGFNDMLQANSKNIAGAVDTIAKAFVAAARIVGDIGNFFHGGYAAGSGGSSGKEPLKLTVGPKPADASKINPPWPGGQPMPETNYQKAVEALIKQNEQLRQHDRLVGQDNATVQTQNKLTELRNALIEDEVDKMRRAGVSEDEILRRRAAGIPIDEKKIQQYQKQIDAFSAMQTKFPQLKQALEDSSNFFTQFDAVAVHAFDGLGDALANIVTGTSDVRSAFKSMVDAILADVVRMTVRMAITKPLLGALGLSGFAEGGDVKAGVPIVVGEKGPEVFMPPSAGRIVPNDKIQAMTPRMASPAAGGGGQVVNINAPITVQGSAGTPAQNNDLADKISKAINEQVRGTIADELRRQMRPGGMLRYGR